MHRVEQDFKKGHTMRQIRVGFITQGTSFHGWCVENLIDSHNARKAIIGDWTGPKAKLLVIKIIKASGLEA